MAPQRLLALVRRWFPLLVLGVVLPSVATFLLASNQPQVYQVSVTLLPAQYRVGGNPDISTVALSRLVGMATNYAYEAKSHDLLQSVGQQLKLTESVLDLTKQVDATVDGNNAALTITARAGDASAAAALANAVAHSIQDRSSQVQNDPSLLTDLETVRTRMLEAEAEYRRLLALPSPHTAEDTLALQNSLTLLDDLTKLYDSLSSSVAQTSGGLVVVDDADPLLAQMIAPRTAYYTLLAAIAGLLIAAGIASLLEYLDDTVKAPADVEDVAGVGTLATIPPTKGGRGRRQIGQLAALSEPRSDVAEAYRALRTEIEFASVDGQIRTLLVTSWASDEGKTTLAANLAVSFAQAGRRVLLVDADLRNPGVHLVFDAPNAHGLATLLRSDEVDVDAITQATEQADLQILTTGPLPPNPAELLGSPGMRVILDRLTIGRDLVIFDGPPLRAVTDSAILSSFLGGTLFVVAAGRSRRGAVRLGSESLARAHANVLGAVLLGAARTTLFAFQPA